MSIIASYNIKGGVGKTAAAVNLAWLAASEGYNTLLWDLDPQGAASFYFNINAQVEKPLHKVIKNKKKLAGEIKRTSFRNLSLIPADFSYRNLDLLLDDKKHSLQHLRDLIWPLTEDYDFIFLDCPPSISLVTESVFQAADYILVPLIPTTLSLRTFGQLLSFAKEHKQRKKILAYFSMVDRRKNLHRLIRDNPPFKDKYFLHTSIPYASDVERMGVRQQPLHIYAASSAAGRAFAELWNELKEKILK